MVGITLKCPLELPWQWQHARFHYWTLHADIVFCSPDGWHRSSLWKSRLSSECEESVCPLALSCYTFIITAFCFLTANALHWRSRLLNELGFLMRGLLHDLLSRFVFQLNLTPPWGLLTALCGCQLRFTKRCALGGIWSSESQPGLLRVCLSYSAAITRSSLSRFITVLVLWRPCHSFTICSSHHCVTVQLHCTCSVSRLPYSYVIVQTPSVCNGPAVSRKGISLSPCIHHRKSLSGTQPLGTAGMRLLPGWGSQQCSVCN